jgi:Tfp pilus assembly protein PilF
VIGKNVALDAFARTLRARAYLAQKNTTDAMSDLNVVLAKRPTDPEALRLRGVAFTSMHQYDKALDDLSGTIAQRETVESYFLRAKIYEEQSQFDKATNDFRRATQLTATSAFDFLAQAEAKKKIQLFSKKVPCSHPTGTDDTCL